MYRTSTLRIVIDSRGAETSAQRLQRQLSGVDKTTQDTSKSVGGLHRELAGLNTMALAASGALGALVGAAGVREILTTTDTYKQMVGQLKLVEGSAGGAQVMLGRLLATASDTRSALTPTVELYTKLKRATDEMGLSNEQLVQATTALNNSFIVSGASADSMENAVRQLAQGLAAGALRGDEFISVQEQAPRLMRAVAESLGVTTGELREMAGEGELTASVILNSLLSSFKQLQEEAETMPETIGQAATKMRNQLIVSFGAIDTSEIVEGINDISEAISSPDFRESVELIGSRLVDALASMAQGLQYADDAAVALAAIYGGKLLNGLRETAQQFILSTQASMAQAKAELSSAKAAETRAAATLRVAQSEQAAAQRALANTRTMTSATQAAYARSRAMDQLAAANARVTTAERALATSTAATATAMRGANVAANALKGTMALLGGPLGIAALAAWGLYELHDAMDDSADKAAELETAVSGVRREIQDLTAAQLENKKADFLGQLLEQQQRATEIAGQISKLSDQVSLEDVMFQGRTGAGRAKLEGATGDTGLTKELEDTLFQIQKTSGALTEIDTRLEQVGKSAGDAGDGIKQLTDETKEAEKAQKEYESGLSSLLDTLYPVEKSQREYREGLDLLADAFMRGDISQARYEDGLDRQAKAFQNAGDWAEVYGFTGKEAADKVKDAADPMAKSWEDAAERIDETFADAFTGAFDSFESFQDQMKDGFKRLLAELAYQATLQPIVVGFTADMQRQMGLTPSSNASLSGGIGSVANNWSGLSSMAGKAWNYGSSLLSGGSSAAAAGGLYGNVAAAGGLYSSAATGAALSTGGLYSSVATGGLASGGALSGAMGAIGTAMPYIGAVMALDSLFGGPISGALGDLFGSDRKYKFGFEQNAVTPSGPVDERYYDSGNYEGLMGGRETAFGSFGYQYKEKFEPADMVKALDTIEQLDNLVASVASASQTSSIKAGLDGFEYRGDDFRELIERRLDVMVQSSGSVFADALGNIVDPQQLATALASGLQIENVGAQMASAVAEDMNAEFREALGSGSDIEAATQAILSSAQAVTLLGDSVDRLGLQFDATAQGALNAAGGLAELVGGVQNLSSLQSQYYQAFYSEQERFANLQSDLSATFSDMGYALPETQAGVRSIVEGLDLMTEAGQEQYATILQLVPSLEQYISGMQEQRAAAQEAADAAQQQAQAQREATAASVLGVVETAYGALEQAVSAEQDMLRDAYESTTESIQDNIARINDAMQTTEQISRSLGNTLSSLRGLSSASSMAAYSSAQDYLRSVVASGGLGNQERLDSALSVVSQQSTDLYSSFTDYQRDLYTTSGLIADLKDRADTQLDSQEDAVSALERQMRQAEEQYRGEMRRLDDMLANQAAQLEAELGQQDWLAMLNESILTIPDALAALAGALETAGNTPGASSPAINADNQADYLAAKTAQLNAIQQGGHSWTVEETAKAIADAGLSLQEHYDRYGKNENIPGFASGGLHTGGWRLVGEQGPELEYTPPSRIYSASQTSSMLDMGDVVAELKALRQDNEYLRNALYQIAKNTGQSTKQLQRWDGEGMPKERDFA